MKRYKFEFFVGEYRPYIRRLTEFSKSGNIDGTRISFLVDGGKFWQEKLKKDKLHGIYKEWSWGRTENIYFQNWKNDSEQGIGIAFK